jgi:hypothetical protein
MILAWAMVPGTAVSLALAAGAGYALMAALGVAEGDPLTSAGPLGAVAAVCLVACIVAPPVAGCVLARRARAAGSGGSAVAVFSVNALLVVWLGVVPLIQLAVW